MEALGEGYEFHVFLKRVHSFSLVGAHGYCRDPAGSCKRSIRRGRAQFRFKPQMLSRIQSRPHKDAFRWLESGGPFTGRASISPIELRETYHDP